MKSSGTPDAMRAIPRQRVVDLARLPVSLRLGGFNSHVFSWGFFKPRWWRNFLHTHTFFEICYAYQGTGHFKMLGTDYPVRAGDVFVAKPGEPHEIVSSRTDPLGIYFWSYTLVPARDSGPTDRAIDDLLDAFLTSRRWVSSKVPGMQRTLELLTEEIVRLQPGYEQVIEGLLKKLLLDTARAVVEPSSAKLHPPPRIAAEAVVQTAVRYLRDNFARPIGVRDVAAQVHLSERHLSRLFRQLSGVSLMDYLTNVCLETACQLLADRELPIKQVAHDVGYPDVRYFTTLFRRRVGQTPAAFRHRGGTRFLSKPVAVEFAKTRRRRARPAP